MRPTGTHLNYYLICHRKLWLFANGINMEATSDLVYEGKLIHETTYPQRSSRYEEIEIEGIKIDYFDPVKRIVHEIKKSDKHEEAHEWQVKYYLLVLERNGLEGVSGILEYPRLRQTREIFLSDPDREELMRMAEAISHLISQENCPAGLPVSRCRNCAYFDFCHCGEDNLE